MADASLPEVQGLCSAVIPAEGGTLSPRGKVADYKIEHWGHSTPCWIWQKHRTRGYGTGSFTALGITTGWAHRAYYIAANGPIPDGLVLDHLCRIAACVNPAHLEPVTNTVNVHRGAGAKITMDIARAVRARVAAGETANLIKADLGVSIQNVWWIAEDRAWREDESAPRQPVWPRRECKHCGADVPNERGRRAMYCSEQHKQAFNNAKARDRKIPSNAHEAEEA